MKKHKCGICEKEFKTKKLVKIHFTAVHDKKETFDCNICETIQYTWRTKTSQLQILWQIIFCSGKIEETHIHSS